MAETIADVVDGLVFRPAAGRVARLVSWGTVQAGVDLLAVSVREAGIAPAALIGVFQGGWIIAQCLADHFPTCPILGVLGCPDGQGGMRAELVSTQAISYDPVSQRMIRRTQTLYADRSEPICTASSVRLYTPSELLAMLSHAGLHVDARFGGYRGQGLTASSDTIVIIGHKP